MQSDQTTRCTRANSVKSAPRASISSATEPKKVRFEITMDANSFAHALAAMAASCTSSTLPLKNRVVFLELVVGLAA